MILALALSTLLASPAAAAAEDAGSLIITFQAAPANCPAFRRELEDSGARQLQRWKDEGALHAYQLIFARHLDSRSWDAMAVLTLKDAARWKAIEREFPAGLPRNVLALATDILIGATALAAGVATVLTVTRPRHGEGVALTVSPGGVGVQGSF